MFRKIVSHKHLLFPSVFSFALLMIVVFIPDYGYFNDEFYYLACADRPAFGYVDHPPLSVFILAAVRFVFGDCLIVLRAVPALCSSVIVFITGILAEESGASVKTALYTSFSISLLPVPLIIFSFYSMNCFEILLMVLIFYYLIRILRDKDYRKWLHIGLLVGLGLLNKHTMILYIFALMFGVVLSGKIAILKNKWFLWGLLIAFIILLPNLIWQYVNDFPSLEFYSNATALKNIRVDPIEVIIFQVVAANPVLFFVWGTGLICIFFSGKKKEFKVFGWAYLFLLIVLILSGSSRPDRMISIYYFLIPYGWYVLEIFTKKKNIRFVKDLLFSFAVLAGLFLVPVSLPVLPPKAAEIYFEKTGLNIPVEAGLNSDLPMFYVYRMDWEKPPKALSKVYDQLSRDEQDHSLILASNYGFASSIEFYSWKYGLPPVVSGHNSYWHWSRELITEDVTTVISFGLKKETLEGYFESVSDTGIRVESQYWYDHFKRPIYICRDPKGDIKKNWKGSRFYI